MNFKTTLVLLGMVATLFAAWFFLLKDGPGGSATHLGRPLLPAFLAREVEVIQLIDPSRRVLESRVELHRRGPDTWEVISDGLDGGRPTRARAAVVQSILAALQDVTPLRVLAEETDLEGEFGFGLGEKQKITVYARGVTFDPCRLEIGAPVGAGGLVCRTNSSPAVYAIPKEILPSLVPKLEHLPDPSLFHIPPLDVERIVVESAGAPKLEIERSFSRWFVRRPFDGIPGDDVRCDELRQWILALSRLRRLGEDEAREALAGPPAHEITLTTQDGASAKLILGGPVRGGVAARLEGEEEAVAISPAILPILSRGPGRYRDRHLVDLPASRVAAVELTSAGRVLRFQRLGGSRFRLVKVDSTETPLRWLDEVEQGDWLEKMQSMQFLSFSSDEEDFEAELTLKVVAGKVGGAGTRSIKITIGPIDDERRRPARVSGQPGQGLVGADALSFLTDPYWDLLERTAWCTDAYFKIGRLRITDGQGKHATLRGQIPSKQADLQLFRIEDGEERQVPPPAVMALQRKLVGGLSVERFLGPARTPGMKLDDPELLVEWFEADGASVDGIPRTEKGSWRKLVIGARRPDGFHYALVDEPLSLVFLVNTADLRPFLNLLE